MFKVEGCLLYINVKQMTTDEGQLLPGSKMTCVFVEACSAKSMVMDAGYGSLRDLHHGHAYKL